jgi:hypothetical protein
MPTTPAKPMSAAMIKARVMRRLNRYMGLNYLEHFALFMGGVQLLEMHHKGLLAQRFGRDLEEMERWTLGRVVNEMRAAGVRPDYCEFLSSLVKSRNFIAHEMLASTALMRSLVKGWSPRQGRKVLDPATYELEQLVVLATWCDKYDGWGAA